MIIDYPRNYQLSVKSCQQKGSGKIRVAATGWVWFNYEGKVPLFALHSVRVA